YCSHMSSGPRCHCSAEFSRFFFSTRGRHTRFSRDWSSDVCSSDLHERVTLVRRHLDENVVEVERVLDGHQVDAEFGQLAEAELRSEERRVGKECKSR